jgi:Flp pilus assembly pilin Flp
MMRELKRFWNDEQGAEFVEWAVVVIILLVAAVIAYVTVGDELEAILVRIQEWLIAGREGSGYPGT